MMTILRARSALFLSLVAVTATVSLEARAAADVVRGGDVFAEECAECHSVREGKNKKGPSMFGVVGRRAATVADASYSDALKGSGLTWTPDKLDAYLAAPKKFVPGGKMKYDGLADAAERASLLAFLATLR
ncbi:MAG: c-type cytochrome [Zoogloea sp.]|jgi:cytochrome c|uniref:c-type cytochrome n=1 Tax=Zoogloea sp. TaxID=49181 RepID=UPI002627EFC9|nr:c-type cytochrome [Zoogloea sp.]MDD3326439.1 c-type cytochrome [Zoogloea sp.]